jgi:hypothetical protein
MFTIFTELKQMFKRPSVVDSLQRELLSAEHALLAAETGVEYAMSMVSYNKARIKRIKASLMQS